MFAALGAAALGAIAVLKVQRYRKMWVVNILLTLAILAQIAVLAIGTDINGNRNWIRFSGIQIQPSEFSKLAIVLWIAMVLGRAVNSKRRHLVQFFPHFLDSCL